MKAGIYLGLCAAFMSALSPAVFAANGLAPSILEYARGKVLVNHGNGFDVFLTGDTVNAGDSIFVGTNSSARVSVSNCAIELAPSSLFIVPNKMSCSAGDKIAFMDGVFITPTAATAQGNSIDNLIATYSQHQSIAANAGDIELANCLASSIKKLKSTKDFLNRNPGVGTQSLISNAEEQAATCHASAAVEHMEPQQIVEQQPIIAPEPAPIPVLPNATPAIGGMGAVAIVAGGLAVVGGGVAALLLLNKKSSAATSAKAN
jgi:hypothetical protein